MKKVYYIFIVNLISTISVFGQSSKTKKADSYFDKLSYVKAAEAYEQLIQRDTTAYVLQRLGDSYYLNAKISEAVKWYELLFSNFDQNEVDAEYYFKYAQALRGTGEYKASDAWLKKFNQKAKEDLRGSNFANPTTSIEDLKPANPSYEIENLTSVNTENSDFGAMFYQDGILFSSVRPQSNLVKRRHTWNNRGFLDLYAVSFNDSISSTKNPIKELNSVYHESSVSFSPDGKTIYFTRNNAIKSKRRKDAKGITNLKIFKAEWIDDEWQNIQELPFNSDEYSIGHPAVSSDGKYLYFVSDMPGTIGQTDIFYVTIQEDNTYGPISSLGITVNTEGREMFPYVIDDKLYFSSDGHFGLGGLDVFVSKKEDNAFQTPVNLKSPINSQADDFAFVVNSEFKGYFSSNREGGQGDDDLYAFTAKPEEVVVVEEKPCTQEVSGIVVDKKFGVPLKDAKIVLTDADGAVVSELITGVSGKFSYFLKCDQFYKIAASKKYYKSDSNTFKTTSAMALELDLDFDLGVVDVFTYNDRDELMIRINPIFFDYNKSNIRKDAAVELDKIVAAMKRFPELIVESTSHTDSRGKAKYNESLSDRRAKSTVRYIVSEGIGNTRISGKGYGENKLTNGCVDNDLHTNRVNCSQEEHQANRRSEFLITNFAELGIASKKVEKTAVIQKKETHKEKTSGIHMVKSGDTLYSIATKYGLTIDQLKKLNNLKNNDILIGQELKIK